MKKKYFSPEMLIDICQENNVILASTWQDFDSGDYGQDDPYGGI